MPNEHFWNKPMARAAVSYLAVLRMLEKGLVDDLLNPKRTKDRLVVSTGIVNSYNDVFIFFDSLCRERCRSIHLCRVLLARFESSRYRHEGHTPNTQRVCGDSVGARSAIKFMALSKSSLATVPRRGATHLVAPNHSSGFTCMLALRCLLRARAHVGRTCSFTLFRPPTDGGGSARMAGLARTSCTVGPLRDWCS